MFHARTGEVWFLSQVSEKKARKVLLYGCGTVDPEGWICAQKGRELLGMVKGGKSFVADKGE